jgi:hypothetical protein
MGYQILSNTVYKSITNIRQKLENNLLLKNYFNVTQPTLNNVSRFDKSKASVKLYVPYL